MRTQLLILTSIFVFSHCYAANEVANNTLPPQDTSEITQKNLSGAIRFGGMIQTGDNESYTENGEFDIKYLHNQMTYTGQFNTLYNDNKSNNEVEQRNQAQGQAQYNLDKVNYIFVNTDYLIDSNDGYDYIWNTQSGYGRQLFENTSQTMTLDAQAGPGYRIAPSNDEDTSIQDNQATLNASIIYAWKFTPKSTFKQTISTSYAQTDTITTAQTSVETKLYKNIGIQFSVNVTHHTATPENSEKTNTLSTINVVYDFS